MPSKIKDLSQTIISPASVPVTAISQLGINTLFVILAY
jgi:hypothetical protein